MKIHEYQGKELFRRYEIPVPNGKVAFGIEQACRAAAEIGNGPWVVKAQIHAGGRGKGGGVKVARTQDELLRAVNGIFGMKLVTPQTGPGGKIVKRLLIEEGAEIDREFYLALTLDRSASKITVIASQAGGMDIEAVAATEPHRIFKATVDPLVGLRDFHSRALSQKMGFCGAVAKQFASILRKLIRLYLECDCSLAEINPLILTKTGELVALDAKINFDENALYRHVSYLEMVDPNEQDTAETIAKKYDLSYISLEGSIGCMVNGAGLAMATMDIIKLEGGDPANFLDVGGGASQQKVQEAFKVILRDPKVKAILVNIFGGIMKCDVIAAGIVAAAAELKFSVPLVVRLEGTNVEQGKEILAKSGLAIIAACGMHEAAKKVVAAAESRL